MLLMLLLLLLMMMMTTTTMMMMMIARRVIQSASLMCSPLWEGAPCRHRASRWQGLATSARLHSVAEAGPGGCPRFAEAQQIVTRWATTHSLGSPR